GDGPHELDAPMFALFDQRIDPATMFAAISVTADGAPVPIRRLEAAELAPDQVDRRLAPMLAAAKELDGRWLAFRATRPFPPNVEVAVTIAAGAPSAEGPNKTRSAQRFAFRTYPPLEITEAECSYGRRCPPYAGYRIELNN